VKESQQRADVVYKQRNPEKVKESQKKLMQYTNN
jgi:hypothetical protein